MSQTNLVVIAVDGFRASALGAYGNTWYSTPTLDRFAADSLLVDWWLAETTELTSLAAALWQSRHPLVDAPAGSSLPAILQESGYDTFLVSDNAQVAALPQVEDFAEHVLLPESESAIAPSLADSGIGRLLGEAAGAILSRTELSDTPFMAWVQARGFYGPWDAPQELRDEMAELDETDPPDRVDVPDFWLDEKDSVAGVYDAQCAYAAQAMLLDRCLAAFWELLSDLPTDRELVVVLLGLRGFPLGEHRRVGGVDERLYVESLHVPCMIRGTSPDFPRLMRLPQLASHVDLVPTLLDVIQLDTQRKPSESMSSLLAPRSLLPLASDPVAPWRQALLAASSSGCRAVRTVDWCLRAQDPHDSSQPETAFELYVRPDDRWETNDVATLCPDVVQELATVLSADPSEIQNSSASSN